MPQETPAEHRLLFVVDNDYGALGTMMYFLHGQPLAQRALMLLPRRVHELHGASLGVASRPYGCVADILEAVDRHRPDLVLLASAYILPAKNALGVAGVRELLRALAQRGLPVATTDPYIGTFREIPAALALQDVPGLRGLLRAISRKLRFALHVRRVAPLVEGLAHFYPVPMPQPATGPRLHSFFNRKYLRSAAGLAQVSADVARLPGILPGLPRWVFLLASYDLELQERRHGRQGFADLAAARIRDAVEQGRHATFIAPPSAIESLAPRFAGEPRVTLMTGCAFDEFEARLLDAEAVFYWQLFSTSTFLRLWHGLPVFFFDEGHNARVFAPMRKAGLERYFMGDAPACRDIAERIDAAGIARGAGEFREAARAAIAKLETLAQPPGMVEAILASR